MRKTALPPFNLPEAVQKRRFKFLDCPMDPLTMQETVTLIEQAITRRERLQHVVVNVAKIMSMQKNPALKDDVLNSDLINIDGMGVVWGARLAGYAVPERVAGCDLMLELMKLCAEKGYKPYILGAKQYILEKAVENLKAQFPSLEFAGCRNGYFTREEEPEIIKHIADSKADCLFIAITSPHKERIMGDYKDVLGVPFLMGVGGSVDVIAGHVRRAPLWMQDWGLEWLYRVIQEPRRMWKRYAVTNARYLLLLIKRGYRKWRRQRRKDA